MILSLNEWLSCADPLRSADAIFVLAGRGNRKLYGLELFRQGLAPKILFSVARFEIRRFSKMQLPVSLDRLKIAADVPSPERHHFVWFEGGNVQVAYVRPGRLGTLTEIESLARWLGKNPEIHSLLIISSSPHLRRLRLCCRALVRRPVQFALAAAPDPSSSGATENGQGAVKSRGAALLELVKLALYWVLLTFLRRRNSQT